MKLENSNIIFLGDSITQGSGTTDEEKCFHQIIKQKYNLNAAHNCGVGGTRIAKQTNPKNHIHDLYFGLRTNVMPQNVDAIVVFGGTNDYGHGDSKMGDISSNDIYTFCGALNSLISDLKEKYPSAKVIFMTPIRRRNETLPNHDGKVLKDYANAIIAITKNHNVPLIDLYNSGIINPNDTDILPDGLHPNDKGHAIMADYIATELLKI